MKGVHCLSKSESNRTATKPPEIMLDAPGEGSKLKIRNGADTQFIAEGLRVWTGDVSIRIDGFPELQRAAAEALVSPNGRGPLTPEEPLPTASTDRSEFTAESPP